MGRGDSEDPVVAETGELRCHHTGYAGGAPDEDPRLAVFGIDALSFGCSERWRVQILLLWPRNTKTVVEGSGCCDAADTEGCAFFEGDVSGEVTDVVGERCYVLHARSQPYSHDFLDPVPRGWK